MIVTTWEELIVLVTIEVEEDFCNYLEIVVGVTYTYLELMLQEDWILLLLLLLGPLGGLGFCRIDQFMLVLLIFLGFLDCAELINLW